MSKLKEIAIQKASNLLVICLFFFGVLLSVATMIIATEYILIDPPKNLIKVVYAYDEQVRLLGKQRNFLTELPAKIDLHKKVLSSEKYLLTIPVVVLSLVMVWIMGISRSIMVNDLLERVKQGRRVTLQERQRKKDALFQLEKSEEHLNQMHEQLTEGFFVINRDERFHHLNRVAIQFLAKWNKTPKSLKYYLQQPIEAFITDYHTSGLSLCVQDAITKKISWQKELNFESLNRWVQVRVYPTGGDTAYVYLKDITAEKTPEQVKKMNDQMITSLSETSPFPMAIMDRQWNYVMVTKSWKETFLLQDEKLIGFNHKAIMPRLPGKWAAVEKQLLESKTVRSERMDYQLNGKNEILSWELAPWGVGEQVQGFVMYASIITDFDHDKEKLEQQREREHKLAYHDILTGLPNRQLFYDRLTMALAHAYRNLGKVSLFFLDLDGFKGINDNLGHDIGDMLLKEVATRLKKCVRDTDTVARLGGDEFTVILNGIASEEDAMHVAGKIIKSINEVFKLGGHDVYVSTSIGISMYPLDGSTSAELMKKADTAMYWSKEGGKNQANFFTKELNGDHIAQPADEFEGDTPENITQRELESHIRTALQKEEIEVHLQPVVNLQNNRVTGLESLVRWQHPQAGLLQPKQFLGIAENTGMILPIGEYILKTMAMKAKQWQSLSKEEVKFSMNLSLRQLKDESLLKRIVHTFKDIKIPTSWFVLEVSEKIVADADTDVLERLKAISNQGFSIYVDDIGESYSSLQQLEGVNIKGFKVKSSIVQGAMNSNEDKNVLLSLKKMADKLGAEFIAKGIETEDQASFVQNIGIQNVQGFAIAKPTKPEKILELL